MSITNWIIVVFGMVVIIGIVRIIYIISRISMRKTYTAKYLKNYNNWLKTKVRSSSDKLYIWLTQNTGQIQTELGQNGVAVNYVAPGLTYTLTNYQVIVNTLPLIKTGIATEVEVNACKDVLNRHIGNLKYLRRNYFFALLNPFKWALEGVKLIITLPIYLFYWVGLYKYSKIVGLEDSKGFKILSRIFALISFFGLIMSIIVDWSNFLAIIKQIKR